MMKLANKSGLTLVELMLASVILLIVLGSLLFTFVQCMILNEQNSNLAVALNDAQYVLEDLRSRSFTEVESYTAADIPATAANLLPAYGEVINVAITNVGLNLRRALVTVNWVERGRARSAQLSTVFVKTA